MAKIKILVKEAELTAEILDKNPKTADAVLKSLPITGNANTWGDEIYFETDIGIKEENSQQEVEVGDVAYWPPGKAICLFFGKTPVSTSDKPKAYSPVNVFARIDGKNLKVLKKVKDGELIKMEKL